MARRAGRMQLNADAESNLLELPAAAEWRPTAATVPANVYLGIHMVMKYILLLHKKYLNNLIFIHVNNFGTKFLTRG